MLDLEKTIIMLRLKIWFIENKLFVLCAIFLLFFGYIDSGIRYDIRVLTLLVLNGLLSLGIIFLLNDGQGFSLNKTFGLFNLFFFSLAPVIQFKNNCSFYIQTIFDENLYQNIALLILVSLVFYIIIYVFVFDRLIKRDYLRKQPFLVANSFVVLGISLISFIGYLYLIRFDLSLILNRPPMFYMKTHTNLGLIGYAILLIVKLIPLMCLMYYKLLHKVNDKTTLILFLIVLTMFFPTAAERVYVGIVYIPLLLLFVPKMRKKYNFVFMLMLGLLVVFPVLNNFRDGLGGTEMNWEYQLFKTGHFDAFQNFMLVLEEEIITNGRQLLGSVLFFVQEGMWPGRPVGSGHLLGVSIGYDFFNVAMPLLGEGYINFGILGVFIFVLICASFNALMDVFMKKNKLTIFFKIVFYVFVAFELYVLRGDLMSSIKISTSILLALSIVHFFILISNKLIPLDSEK